MVFSIHDNSHHNLVPRGGWLMEYYLHACSSWSVNALFTQYLITIDPSMKSSKFADILDKCSSHFSGWLVFHINSIGSVGRKQMFYITFVNHYFGLSRAGIEMNSALGYGVTLGMYDRERKNHEQLSVQRTKAVIDSGLFVQWWDNFSKFTRKSVPTISKDVFGTCLWTGVTVNAYEGPVVDISVRRDQAGVIVPAMPENLFEHQTTIIDSIKYIYNEGMDYYDRSKVKKYDVINIPLKIDTKVFPRKAAVLNSAKNTAKNINPYKLLRHNIGSNLGLTTILREFQDDNKMSLHNTVQNYTTINTDENIFYRGLKVSDCMLYVCFQSVFFPCCLQVFNMPK